VTKSVLKTVDQAAYQENCLTKVKLKLANNLISGIPVLSGTDSEEILKFLIRVKQVLN
jgi:hypothetical protein